MSWSVTTNLVSKRNARAAISLLEIPETSEAWAHEQLRIAQDAAKQILSGIPGPYVVISLSGHANGTGWNKKDGYANDSVTVSISQVCTEDLKHYNTINELET